MSIMHPHHHHPQPKPTAAHNACRRNGITLRRCLPRACSCSCLPSILLLVVDPLVPILAYLLQVWAGSPGYWRERWAGLVVRSQTKWYRVGSPGALSAPRSRTGRGLSQPSRFTFNCSGKHIYPERFRSRCSMGGICWHVPSYSCRWPQSWLSIMNVSILAQWRLEACPHAQ